MIEWDATEYVQREHKLGWYFGLFGVGTALILLAIFWLKSWSFVALVVVMILALMVYTLRAPRTLHYSLSDDGLREGEKHYAFEDFRSFGVLQEGAHYSLVLMPAKRFMPAVKVYFPEVAGEKIVDAFGARLPMEEVKLDLIDRIVGWLGI